MRSPPLATLEALFLDAGNTLIGMDLDLVCELLARHGVAATPDAVARAEAAARPRLSRLLATGLSSEARDTFAFHVANTLARLGVPEARRMQVVLELARDMKAVGTRRLWSRVLPGVPQALAELHAAGIKLAVVSNSDGTVEEGLERLGLRAPLDAVLDSTRVGVEKPDPRIFARALEVVGSLPARTAHVGDLFAVDVLGARAAGLHGVLVDPYGDWCDEPCATTRDVPTLARELLAARASSSR
ncbi:MAG: HAD-IA family hydrolase [Thermodesulfobacteriota bacterium]